MHTPTIRVTFISLGDILKVTGIYIVTIPLIKIKLYYIYKQISKATRGERDKTVIKNSYEGALAYILDPLLAQ